MYIHICTCILNMLGAFFGAMICFHLIRRYNFAKYIKLSASKQEKYHAIQEAIEQGGFKVINKR